MRLNELLHNQGEVILGDLASLSRKFWYNPATKRAIGLKNWRDDHVYAVEANPHLFGLLSSNYASATEAMQAVFSAGWVRGGVQAGLCHLQGSALAPVAKTAMALIEKIEDIDEIVIDVGLGEDDLPDYSYSLSQRDDIEQFIFGGKLPRHHRPITNATGMYA